MTAQPINAVLPQIPDTEFNHPILDAMEQLEQPDARARFYRVFNCLFPEEAKS